MTRRADGKAEEVVTSPTPPQNRKPYGAISIETPIRCFRESQTTRSDVTPAQGQQALKDLIFTFANANADSSIANVNETTEALNAYVKRHQGKTSKITALLYLKFISDYAADIAFPNVPAEQYEFATDYVNALLSEKKIEIKNGKTIQSPLIETIPNKLKAEAITQMVTSFIGTYGRIHQNTTRAIDTFKESLQDPTRRKLFHESPSSSEAAKPTPPKPKPKKLSIWKKLKTKWKKLSRGWKIFAGVVIGLCSLCIIITALVCPASLIITIPVVGKCAVKTLIMASAGAVATVTMTGHGIHISFTKIKMNSEGEEQVTEQGTSTDTNNSDNAGKSEEHIKQLSEDEQQAISNAIQSTVRELVVAGANELLAELEERERETKQSEEGALSAASYDAGSPPSPPNTSAPGKTSPPVLSRSSSSFFANSVRANDMLRPMREEEFTGGPTTSPAGQHQETNAPASQQGAESNTASAADITCAT